MLIHSENSAIKRKKPSVPARYAVEHIIPNLPSRIISTPPSILDFGCGYGADVSFYKSLGAYADGYDPNPKFGYDKKPYTYSYDLVTCVYVLNVLHSKPERTDVIRTATSHLKSNGGTLFLAVRTKKEIDSLAKKQSWKKYKDGYYTGKSKKTFQCGFSKRKLQALFREHIFERYKQQRSYWNFGIRDINIDSANGFVYATFNYYLI